MIRLVPALALGLLAADTASAFRCRGGGFRPAPAPAYFVPVVPYYAPPQHSPPPAFVPKKGVGLREEEGDSPARPRDSEKPRIVEGVDPPKIGKPRRPIPLEDDVEFPKRPAPLSVEQYVVPMDGKRTPSAEVKVGFFNHSDREVLLTVNGESLKLPSEQYVTVRLPRTFTWSETGRAKKDVAVPPDAEGLEIVFRK